jgi:hypothetical protein
MNVDRFKSQINKRGGLAPANRFAVYIPAPLVNFDPQALIARALKKGPNTKNLLTFNDPRDMSILCESVTMPGRQVSTTDLQNNMLPLKLPYNFLNDDVTMTFHTTNDHYVKKHFEKWVTTRIIDKKTMTLNYRSSYAVDIIIEQLDQQDNPVYTCVLKNAYPIAVTSYELSNSAENTTQKVTVTFTYENWEEQGFLGALLSKGKSLLGSVGQTFGL